MQPLWACFWQEDGCCKYLHCTQWTEDPHPPANHLPGHLLPIPAILQENRLYETILGLHPRPLYKRFAEHLLATQDPSSTCPVGLHWRQRGHNISHIEFIGVEKLGTQSWPVLQARERDKINVTGLVTAGINVIEFVRIKQLGCSEDLV